MKNKKILEIATIMICVAICLALIIFFCTFLEMLNDYRCYNLPLNEFFQDKRCERYWDMKKWSEK